MTPGQFDNYQESLHVQRYEYACGFVRQAKVLDVACGTGYGCEMLRKAGAASVHGVDLSPEAIEYSKKVYSSDTVTYAVGDAQNLSALADESFDVVTSFETIEHIPDVSLYLAEIRRVLKPGGIYLVSTPDRRLASTMYPLRGKPNNPFHIREYTQAEFRSVVSSQFSLTEGLGQSYVSRFLTFWPVQVGLKAACYSSRRFGAYRMIDRLYHSTTGTAVEPAQSHPWSVATFWLIRALRK